MFESLVGQVVDGSSLSTSNGFDLRIVELNNELES